MKLVLKLLKTLAKTAWIVVLGIGVLIFLIFCVIFGSPLFLYRWLVTKLIAPCYIRRHGTDALGKAVTVNGHSLATEFLKTNFSPRCTTIINMTMDGPVSYQEVYSLLEEKWINFKTEQGILKYPELQQYPESWMGYMFWKPEVQFQVKDHIFWHDKLEEENACNLEEFTCQLIEELVNKPYIAKRSPWEIHVVPYCRPSNNEVCPDPKKLLTFSFILRIHHCMADGYALMHLLLEQLSGNKLETSLFVTPETKPVSKSVSNSYRKIINFVTFPAKVIYEYGIVLSWAFRPDSEFYVPDQKKSWRQIYGRMKPVPISKVKYIKRVFGVGFISVLISALAGGVAKMQKRMAINGRKNNNLKNLLVSIAVPKGNHPKKLRMHVLGVAFDIPVAADIDSLERLRKCERNVLKVKNSPMVLLAGTALSLFASMPAYLARHFMLNRVLSAGLTSFPGPGTPVNCQGRKVLGMDFAAGMLMGVCGLGFMALSYDTNVQICATAENAVLSREEFGELLEFVYDEFDVLHGIAESSCENLETEKSALVEDV